MYTRSLFETADMLEQHKLLNRVAALIDAGTLKTTVSGSTAGVQGLLDEVDTSTGGILTPVTDTVNTVLDPVTGLLGH